MAKNPKKFLYAYSDFHRYDNNMKLEMHTRDNEPRCLPRMNRQAKERRGS